MRALRLASAGIALLTVAACAEVWGIPERQTDDTIVCGADGCTCAPGHEDCDKNQDNGCEANLAADGANCGACGVECRNGACQASQCQCDSGWADCDGDLATGCETDITIDLNCGGCGVVCENGACQDGACECATGFADCDEDHGACESELASDAANCGACGHDCLGGDCTAGACGPIVLADAVSLPSDLLVHDGVIYLGSPGLETMPVDGGPLVPLLSPSNEFPGWLFATDELLYFSDVINIKSMPFDASAPPTVMAVDQYMRNDFVVAGPYAYWLNGGDGLPGELRRVPLAGGPVEKLADGGPERVFANSTHLYWTDYVAMYRWQLPDGPMELFKEPADQVYIVAVDDEAIYWDRNFGDALTRTDIASGDDVDLIPGASPLRATLDATNLYMIDAIDATLRVVPKDGSGPDVTLVSGLDSTDAFFPAIDDDAEAVYWLLSTRVGKVAK